jgi:hypothetical protein
MLGGSHDARTTVGAREAGEVGESVGETVVGENVGVKDGDLVAGVG